MTPGEELADVKRRLAEVERKLDMLLELAGAGTPEEDGGEGGVVERDGWQFPVDPGEDPATEGRNWQRILGEAGLSPDGPAAG